MESILKTKENQQILNDLTTPVLKSGRNFKFLMLVLSIVIALGIFAYYKQLKHGLIVTAMRDYTSWGIYISNFVFFVAVSLVGSLISSILKLANAKWSYPLTRIAEMVAVASIICASIIIIVDMGRPDRFFHVITHGRIQSPIIWDVIVIITYLVISILLLLLPLLPDLAICRDQLNGIPQWKKRLYKVISLNWKGSPIQQKRLNRTSSILEIMVIPVAFAIHTITSWLFATTWRPGWDSTNLGPAFKMVGVEGEHITELFSGKYSAMYWFVQIIGLILPIIILLFRRGRRPLIMLLVSFLVILGAWLKRFLIVIPSLQHPYLPIQDVDESYLHYYPTWEEWAITLATFAGVVLMVSLMMKIFPVIPITESINNRSSKIANNDTSKK